MRLPRQARDAPGGDSPWTLPGQATLRPKCPDEFRPQRAGRAGRGRGGTGVRTRARPARPTPWSEPREQGARGNKPARGRLHCGAAGRADRRSRSARRDADREPLGRPAMSRLAGSNRSHSTRPRAGRALPRPPADDEDEARKVAPGAPARKGPRRPVAADEKGKWSRVVSPCDAGRGISQVPFSCKKSGRQRSLVSGHGFRQIFERPGVPPTAK